LYGLHVTAADGDVQWRVSILVGVIKEDTSINDPLQDAHMAPNARSARRRPTLVIQGRFTKDSNIRDHPQEGSHRSITPL
jgi:hypothetical protein